MNKLDKIVLVLALLAAIGVLMPGCNGESHDHNSGTHTHADGSTHDDHGPGNSDPGHDTDGDEGHEGDDHDHAHDEMALEPALIGDMTVELAQGHGAIKAGQESHLVVKLPYNDNGATIVRAWIGTDDRTLSFVGKGEYAPSHDDYDIHAMAPDPLPANTMWWIEIEKPDGTKVVGSGKPMLE